MNLYLRFLWLIMRQLLRRNTNAMLDSQRLHFRVWPHDCDINLHLTNSRYLGFGDLGRLNFLLTTRFGRSALKQRWAGVVNAQVVTYIRPLAPMARFEMETELLGWDEKYWYFEHRFLKGETLQASILVRGVFLSKGKVLSMQQVTHLSGEQNISPELPERIHKWRDLLRQKRQDASAG